jgi:tripartite ATP-independent transporter DctM subunit
MLATVLVLLLILLAISLPVAGALGVLGLVLDRFYSAMPLTNALGENAWSTSTDFLLVAIPMFVLLGEILLRAGVAERMYGSMVKWLSWIPGGLMHSNIGACAVFAATSGSSVATAATVGTVALPLVKQHGYNESLFLGTLAAGGTLGILIPPSINMIIYAVLTDTSIPKLYLAGIIPGLGLAALFMLMIAAACLIRREWGGIRMRVTWNERVLSLIDLAPPLGIFLVVVGSIYAGLATPTEAAALGVIAGLVLAKSYGKLSFGMLRQAFENTMKITAMIMLIIMAAAFLNFVISAIGLTAMLTGFVTGLGLSKYEMLFAVVIFYLILGCFMETLSMMITTIPIVTPVMIQLGFDPVWFGIVMVLLIEMALITPPVGLNLYVVQSLRKSGSLSDVISGSLPFVIVMLLVIVLLTLFPAIALWLPTSFGYGVG